MLVKQLVSVILLRLEGPMQSWGIGSKFTDRHTEAEPTKSGVIGLLCSALGRPRSATVDDLIKMKMAVRVDREGQIFYDYHTTMDVLRARSNGISGCDTYYDLLKLRKEKKVPNTVGIVISRRFYLADACFLVGLESENIPLLNKIIHALKEPKWPPYLGRKSFPTSAPICLTISVLNQPLLEILKKFPWQGRSHDECPKVLRLVYECDPEEGEPRFDIPVSFKSRRFRSRTIKMDFIPSEVLVQEV